MEWGGGVVWAGGGEKLVGVGGEGVRVKGKRDYWGFFFMGKIYFKLGWMG